MQSIDGVPTRVPPAQLGQATLPTNRSPKYASRRKVLRYTVQQDAAGVAAYLYLVMPGVGIKQGLAGPGVCS